MKTVNEIIARAYANGFEINSTLWNDLEERNETILTAIDGEYHGEVIDIHFEKSGELINAWVSSQFVGHTHEYIL